MTQRLIENSFTTTSLATMTSPRIANVVVTNSSYTPTGNADVSTSGGYIRITGSGFTANTQVLINTATVTSISYVNTTQLNVQVPATAAGTYIMHVVNSDGAFGIRVNAISFS